MAPSSTPLVPRKMRWLWIRFSSANRVRIHCARSRHLDLDQPLDRAHVGQLVREEGQVVHPRRVGDALPVRLLLEVLLEAGVDVADVGVQADHDLAVQRHDQAQHAVRGRVVGAEVDGDQVLALGRVDLAGRGAGDLRRLPQRARPGRMRVRSSTSDRVRELDRLAADRVVLAQRMPVPVGRHDQPPQVRDGRRTGSPSGRTARARASRPSATRRRRWARGPRRSNTCSRTRSVGPSPMWARW